MLLLILLLCTAASASASRMSALSKRIIGGYPVGSGESPFLVSLQKMDAESGASKHYCGASVIGSQFLLTAAHCVMFDYDKPETIKAFIGTVRSGPSQSHETHTHTEDTDEFRAQAKTAIEKILNDEFDYALNEENTEKQKRQSGISGGENNSNIGTVKIGYEASIEKVFMNEFYDAEYVRNDIAVLKLTAPIAQHLYSSSIVPIALPTLQMEREGWPPAGTKCSVFGWGLSHVPQNELEARQEDYETTANKVDAIVQSTSKCELFEKYVTRGVAYAGYNDSIVFCAGNIGPETYGAAFRGDSGGPLICGYDGRYYQAGVVSYGSNDFDAYIPGFYTRVTAYEEWIKQVIRDNRD